MALLIAEQKQIFAYIDDNNDLIIKQDSHVITITEANVAQFISDLSKVYIVGYLGE
jgi:hypothetical protein